MYPGSFTQAAIPFTSGSPWCQPASTTKLALNSVCSIPIKPNSQHHPSHFHSSVHVVGETRANHLGHPHVPLISLAISCHPVLLLSPSQAQLPPAHRWPWEGSALVPCQECYKLHHINFWDWRDRSSVQLPILKMHKVEKEQSIYVSCVSMWNLSKPNTAHRTESQTLAFHLIGHPAGCLFTPIRRVWMNAPPKESGKRSLT